MHWLSKNAFCGLAAVGVAAAAAPAFAGCGVGAPVQPAVFSSASGGAGLTPANLGAQGIVGMWSVQFLANGGVFDTAYAQWHSDGTELMNSLGRTPASGNVCMGVWTQTGPFSYHLRHLALSFDPATGKPDHRDVISEDVTVDPRGQSFSGPFTIDAYDPKSGAQVAHIAGTINGQRVNP
ncbi:MAG: hypothetical protein JO127_14130 [Caulobacteraceae bacterium]|nr:hypothetical protein [Caulobacteraceae bacterium]